MTDLHALAYEDGYDSGHADGFIAAIESLVREFDISLPDAVVAWVESILGSKAAE
jgi:hypothetical protein